MRPRFMAANLSAVMDDTDKVRQFYEDALANGLQILPPDVNTSEYRFVPVDKTTIRYGLGAIRGTGESAISRDPGGAPAPARSRDLFDFCRRVDKRLVNRRAIEALVRAGAFDAVDANRARLLASVGRALEAAEQAERQASQIEPVRRSRSAARRRRMPASRRRPGTCRQMLLEEKAALGFYLSGHLFSVYERELAGFPRTPLARLAASEQRAWMAGVVAAARSADDAARPHDGGDARRRHGAGRDLGVQRAVREAPRQAEGGRAARRRGQGAARRVLRRPARDAPRSCSTSPSLRARYAARLRIAMNGQADAKRLQEVLAPYRHAGQGACQVLVLYENGKALCQVALGDAWRVRPDSRLLDELGAWLTPENVQVVYGAL